LNPRNAFRRLRDFQSRSFGRSDTSPGEPSVSGAGQGSGGRKRNARHLLPQRTGAADAGVRGGKDRPDHDASSDRPRACLRRVIHEKESGGGSPARRGSMPRSSGCLRSASRLSPPKGVGEIEWGGLDPARRAAPTWNVLWRVSVRGGRRDSGHRRVPDDHGLVPALVSILIRRSVVAAWLHAGASCRAEARVPFAPRSRSRPFERCAEMCFATFFPSRPAPRMSIDANECRKGSPTK
jgi:hypothetical protein